MVLGYQKTHIHFVFIVSNRVHIINDILTKLGTLFSAAYHFHQKNVHETIIHEVKSQPSTARRVGVSLSTVYRASAFKNTA